VTRAELKRWLAGTDALSKRQGGQPEGLSRRQAVRFAMHGKGQELKTGTVEGIKKALGLKGRE